MKQQYETNCKQRSTEQISHLSQTPEVLTAADSMGEGEPCPGAGAVEAQLRARGGQVLIVDVARRRPFWGRGGRPAARWLNGDGSGAGADARRLGSSAATVLGLGRAPDGWAARRRPFGPCSLAAVEAARRLGVGCFDGSGSEEWSNVFL
jgi:hypothetical protein